MILDNEKNNKSANTSHNTADSIADNEIARKTAHLLLQINAIKLNPKQPFVWASGWKSPIYCDNRIALSFPSVREYLSQSLALIIRDNYPNTACIAAVATGAIGMGMLVATELKLPFVYVRSEPKKHGRKNRIEGQIPVNKKVIVIEDLVSTGGSSLQAILALKKEGAIVSALLAIFDYGFSAAKEKFAKEKVPFSSLSNYNSLLTEALLTQYIQSTQFELLKTWSKDPENWQNIL